MIGTVIVSGGMIQKDFALDFIRKIEEERKGKKLLLLAADRGLDFFLETGLVPDIVDGDLTVYQVLERHIWRVLTIQKLSD